MSWKNLYEDYLHFSKKDRIGGLAVVAIVAFIVFSPKLFPPSSAPIVANSVLEEATDTLLKRYEKGVKYSEARGQDGFQYEVSERKDFTKGELFAFDPNILPAEGWQRLGLSSRTAKTIVNYRNKGGKFYKPEDLKKIWGLPQGFYDRVADYIQLESSLKPFKKGYASPAPYEKKERNFSIADVNSADTSAFIALPGIGSKLAARIITFREKLGGFYSVTQIKETYGLPDSTFQKIKPFLQVNASAIKKLNINTATKDELKVHPYIRWNLANAIVEYRNQHGAYKSVDEIKNIVLIDETIFEKISPYLIL